MSIEHPNNGKEQYEHDEREAIEEFNLSNCINDTNDTYEHPPREVIYVESVKEFIKILRNDLIIHFGEVYSCDANKKINDILDKLAGDKLI